LKGVGSVSSVLGFFGEKRWKEVAMRRALPAMLFVAVALMACVAVWAADGSYVSGNFGGRGASATGMSSGQPAASPESIGLKRMYYFDPANPNIPVFDVSACREVDIDVPEPDHLPGVGVSSEFDRGVTDKVTVRAHSDSWIRDAFFLIFIFYGPGGEIVDRMPWVFISDPWAVVALWDYWEWCTGWQYIHTKDTNRPGMWHVEVFFGWYGQTEAEAMEQLVGTVDFMLKGERPTAAAPVSSSSEWKPPAFDLMTLCRSVDFDAIQFEMLPPLGSLEDGAIIGGSDMVFAYIRFVNDFERSRLLNESFHVVFRFRYADPRVIVSLPHMDPYIFDVPHARTSFKTWEYWSDYYVTPINFTPSELGLYSGQWFIDISVYPHWGGIWMERKLGTISFFVAGGGAPEPPDSGEVPSDIRVMASPNPSCDEVTFKAFSWTVLPEKLDVQVYDLTGNLVFSDSGSDAVTWYWIDRTGVDLRNGAYKYVATVRYGGEARTFHGFVYRKR